MATPGFQNVRTKQLAAMQLIWIVGIKQNQWVQVAVTSVDTLAQRSWYFFSISAMAKRMSANRLRGMVESMHM